MPAPLVLPAPSPPAPSTTQGSTFITFDEVWEQLEVRGSRLPEDHYHQMLKNFPSFSRLILHEVQDKKQRFWNLVEEAEHSGEKFSSAELKN